jgi:hypothetical protein
MLLAEKWLPSPCSEWAPRTYWYIELISDHYEFGKNSNDFLIKSPLIIPL